MPEISKAGGVLTVLGSLSIFLVENAQLISVIAVLIGAALAIIGFVFQRRDANARNKREVAAHEQQMSEYRTKRP